MHFVQVLEVEHKFPLKSLIYVLTNTYYML
nr:MAG TPA: hypothetical protein [Caudoviricetes sp.]